MQMLKDLNNYLEFKEEKYEGNSQSLQILIAIKYFKFLQLTGALLIKIGVKLRE